MNEEYHCPYDPATYLSVTSASHTGPESASETPRLCRLNCVLQHLPALRVTPSLGLFWSDPGTRAGNRRLPWYCFTYNGKRYTLDMIQSFKDEDTYELFQERKNRRWQNLKVVALRKLDILDSASTLLDLRIPPNNRLEAMSGDRRGQHSIRINNQYRICFVWKDNRAHEVEIVDPHR
jgi:proteic killer suppression protein